MLVGSTLALLPLLPAHAAESMTLGKQGPGEVLVGEPAELVLTARNTGDQQAYNLSLRDELPLGVTYVPGSTRPESLGEPRVVVTAGV